MKPPWLRTDEENKGKTDSKLFQETLNWFAGRISLVRKLGESDAELLDRIKRVYTCNLVLKAIMEDDDDEGIQTGPRSDVGEDQAED